MNRLKGLRVYLAGPIDYCPNGGRQWRDELTPFLVSKEITVLDPTNKTINLGVETTESINHRRQIKKDEKFDELRSLMGPVREFDLRCVDLSDALIVNIDFSIKMWGTFEEIAIANLQKKPVIIRCVQGRKEMPDWSFRQLKHELFFDNWSQVNDYLNYIDSAESIETLGRWRFLEI